MQLNVVIQPITAPSVKHWSNSMTNQHPIPFPPQELVDEWWLAGPYDGVGWKREFITKVYQWGADQELEACCKCLTLLGCSGTAAEVRAARRPKPPSLKEQALAILDDCSDRLDGAHENTIRRALEQLND
jgi:hypothetical protein